MRVTGYLHEVNGVQHFELPLIQGTYVGTDEGSTSQDLIQHAVELLSDMCMCSVVSFQYGDVVVLHVEDDHALLGYLHSQLDEDVSEELDFDDDFDEDDDSDYDDYDWNADQPCHCEVCDDEPQAEAEQAKEFYSSKLDEDADVPPCCDCDGCEREEVIENLYPSLDDYIQKYRDMETWNDPDDWE